jgi:hypothetical protein
MSGQVDAGKRARLWQTKRVFYCTPQVVQKDLASGIVPCESISLVVIDEAHKAVGQYAYAVLAAELSRANPRFRILALSATPGKDKFKVQEIITNLMIQGLEYKSETDFDVKPYVCVQARGPAAAVADPRRRFQKMIEVIQVDLNRSCLDLISQLNSIAGERLRRLKSSGTFPTLPGDVGKLSAYQITACMQGFSPAMANVSQGQYYMLNADLGACARGAGQLTRLCARPCSAAVEPAARQDLADVPRRRGAPQPLAAALRGRREARQAESGGVGDLASVRGPRWTSSWACCRSTLSASTRPAGAPASLCLRSSGASSSLRACTRASADACTQGLGGRDMQRAVEAHQPPRVAVCRPELEPRLGIGREAVRLWLGQVKIPPARRARVGVRQRPGAACSGRPRRRALT